MKTINVSQAEGPVLDWLVAKALSEFEWNLEPKRFRLLRDEGVLAYTTNWSQGGPILSEAHISRTIDHSGLWIAYWTDGYTEGDEGKKWMQCHRSELVAGLRCFVMSELGETVEVPEELT